jgi:DNA-directed RNA polymerase alpha subunit
MWKEELNASVCGWYVHLGKLKATGTRVRLGTYTERLTWNNTTAETVEPRDQAASYTENLEARRKAGQQEYIKHYDLQAEQ